MEKQSLPGDKNTTETEGPTVDERSGCLQHFKEQTGKREPDNMYTQRPQDGLALTDRPLLIPTTTSTVL